jgi:hypothetical protein
MKPFSKYHYDMSEIALDRELETLLESVDIHETSIKPQIARVISYAILASVISRQNAIQRESDINKKLNLLAEQNRYNAYLSILQIAIDQNDPTLLRKIRRP